MIKRVPHLKTDLFFSDCERGRSAWLVRQHAILVNGSIGFSNLLKHIKESLILAQKERWQRA